MDYLPLALSIALVSLSLLALLAFKFNSFRYVPRLRSGQSPLPPGSLGLPLVGQSLEFYKDFKTQPDNFWRRRIDKYGDTGLYKTHMLGQATIVATNPETVKYVLLNDEKFGSGWPQSIKTLSGDRSFLHMSGEEHKRLRRLALSSLSSPKALKSMIDWVEKLTLEAMNDWADKGEVVVLPELKMLLFDTISGTVASIPPGTESREFCTEFEMIGAGYRVLPINFPGFAYHRALQGRKLAVKRIQGYMDNRNAHPEVNYGDILETLMRMTDEDGKHMSPAEIIDMILGFLFAAHKTSAHTILWAMFYLSTNPEKLKKLKEEQLKVVAEKGRVEGLTPSDYKSMVYLNWVIDETLRLMNVSPFTYRKALKTVELNGFTIPEGWSVASWARAVHLREDLYPEPYEFKPERWENLMQKAGAFVPFGMGSRSCIGKELAKLEVAVFVHHLVLKYRWEAVNPDAKIEYLPHPKPADGYTVRFYREDSTATRMNGGGKGTGI